MAALFAAPSRKVDLRQLYFNAPAPPRALQAPKQTLAGYVNEAVAGLGRKAGLSKSMARKIATLADISAVGNVASAFDAGSQIRGGDWLGGGLGALLAVGPVPAPVRRLLPAVRIGGKVYAAPGTHFDALDQLPAEIRQSAVMDGNNRGFATEAGKFLNRRKAADYAREHGLFAPDAPSYAREMPELIGEWLAQPKPQAAKPSLEDFWQAVGG